MTKGSHNDKKRLVSIEGARVASSSAKVDLVAECLRNLRFPLGDSYWEAKSLKIVSIG